MKTSKIYWFLLCVFFAFLYLNCNKKYPRIIRVLLTDTITGKPIANMTIDYTQTKNPFLTDKETYDPNGWFTFRKPNYYDGKVKTDSNGYAEFKLEKTGMDYVNFYVFKNEMHEKEFDYYYKYIKLDEVERKEAKSHVYKIQLYPATKNLTYKVILKFKNPVNGTNNNDSITLRNYIISNYHVEDWDSRYENNLNFKLKIQRGEELEDSSAVFFAPNANHKQTRKVRMYFRGKIGKKKYGTCGDDAKEFTLEPNKLNRIILDFD